MMGYAHALFGVGLASLLLGKHDPLWTTVFAYAGSRVPDLDLKYKHRKLLHNLFSMILLTSIVYTLWPSHALAFLIGYLSHLALDLVTVGGVWLLWPLSKRAFKLGLCKSSSWVANTIFSALGLAFIIYRLTHLGLGQ